MKKLLLRYLIPIGIVVACKIWFNTEWFTAFWISLAWVMAQLNHRHVDKLNDERMINDSLEYENDLLDRKCNALKEINDRQNFDIINLQKELEELKKPVTPKRKSKDK